ncbi:hypothetical protein N665_4040s0004 [Sinapis alba]|nr:hypothetical protein N665_4040s0004 [Sinapis alba]
MICQPSSRSATDQLQHKNLTSLQLLIPLLCTHSSFRHKEPLKDLTCKQVSDSWISAQDTVSEIFSDNCLIRPTSSDSLLTLTGQQ